MLAKSAAYPCIKRTLGRIDAINAQLDALGTTLIPAGSVSDEPRHWQQMGTPGKAGPRDERARVLGSNLDKLLADEELECIAELAWLEAVKVNQALATLYARLSGWHLVLEVPPHRMQRIASAIASFRASPLATGSFAGSRRR